jgi:hypothetical protein
MALRFPCQEALMPDEDWEAAYTYLSIKNHVYFQTVATTLNERKEAVKKYLKISARLSVESSQNEWNDEDFWEIHLQIPAIKGEAMEPGLAELAGFRDNLPSYLDSFVSYSLFKDMKIDECLNHLKVVIPQLTFRAVGGETLNVGGAIQVNCDEIVLGDEATSFALCHEFGHTVDLELRAHHRAQIGLPFLRKFLPDYDPYKAEPRTLEVFADLFSTHLLLAVGMNQSNIVTAATALFGKDAGGPRYPPGAERVQTIRKAIFETH